MSRLADRIQRRIANEPAIIVALVWALARAFLDIDLDRETLTVAVDQALSGKWVAGVEGLVGGGIIRKLVYGPRTIDDNLDAETVLGASRG